MKKAIAWIVVGVVVGLAASGVAEAAKSIGQIAASAATDVARIPNFIEIVLYVIGVVMVGTGIVKFKRYNDSSRDQRLGGAVATLIVGVGLIAAPTVYQGVAKTLSVDTAATIEKPSID